MDFSSSPFKLLYMDKYVKLKLQPKPGNIQLQKIHGVSTNTKLPFLISCVVLIYFFKSRRIYISNNYLILKQQLMIGDIVAKHVSSQAIRLKSKRKKLLISQNV
jgi:hypothetical protein